MIEFFFVILLVGQLYEIKYSFLVCCGGPLYGPGVLYMAKFVIIKFIKKNCWRTLL
jgi:hypothetical protein